VDPRVHRASEVGDEPLLLARHFPTIVARDRLAGAGAARAAGASVIVMDDGFQNPSLAKDMALLVVDGRRGLGNGEVFPAGPLRAPWASQLACADAIVVVGESRTAIPMRASAKDTPLFSARLTPDAEAVAALRAQPVLAFAGIGDPEKFFRTLDEAGIQAPVRHGFPDHHRYQPAEANRLLAEAERHGLVLLTTEKDRVRLEGGGHLAALRARAQVLPVTLTIDDEVAFAALLRRRIRSA
jgi:tetraacyldisaccharide 4'-kinase